MNPYQSFMMSLVSFLWVCIRGYSRLTTLWFGCNNPHERIRAGTVVIYNSELKEKLIIEKKDTKRKVCDK